MTTVYWTASSGSPALASTDANWSTGAAPGAGDIAYFRNASSNYNCTWDISTQFGSIYVNSDYTGTITLACDIDMTHTSQGPVFGNTASTINTNNFDVTWQHAGSSYYFSIGGTINWGTSDLTASAAITGAGSNAIMNIGAGTWLAGDDWRFGSIKINITGDALISGSGTPKALGGGIWDMSGHSPTIVCSRPYNQTIQINDPGTSTWKHQYTSNDSDTWNLGSGSFYNLIIDDNNNNQEVGTFLGGPANALDFATKIDNNLTINGSTMDVTSYTKLLLHCDGENSGGTFMDDSGRLHTIIGNGNVHTDTSVKKFGTASAQFDGTGDYLQVAANGDWDVGTGDFTIDCWVYTSTTAGAGYILETRDGSNLNNFALYRSGDEVHYYAQGGSIQIDSGAALTVDTWHHIALVRDGSDVELFVDGVSKGTVTDANDYQGAAPLLIGARYSDEHYWTGYMDEFRWSKGVARWDAAFTPETSAYDFVPSLIVGGQVLINDNAAGSSSGKLYVVSGSVKAGDINADTGGTFDAPNGLTFISPIGSNVWRSTGGTINHNDGLVKISNIGGIATNCQVDGTGANNFYDLEIAMDTGNKVEFTGTPTIIDNDLYVTSGRFQGNGATQYLQVGEVTRVSHESGTFAPSGGPVRGTPTRAAILGGNSQTANNTFKDVTIYNSGTMEATTGETILNGGGISWADLSNDDGSDESTRFIHNNGTIVGSGGSFNGKMGSAEDNNVPGIAGGSGMPAVSDTYGCYNLTMNTTSTFSLGGGGYQGYSGDFTIDTAGYGFFDRQVRVGGNLNLNQGELRIDGSNKNLWVNGNVTMASGTKLGGKRTDGSHPHWIGWMMVDGSVALGIDSELYLASGTSASDKWDFVGTKIGGNWINNGGTATE
tara:strand:+ start:1538 stop:4195 length:2658 start_codon:yes stop_codon:yes gene_type:complete